MPEKIFLGLEYTSGSSNPNDDIHYLSNFTAEHGGILSRIGVYSNSVGNIKLNLYEVYGGVPTNLLWADDVGIACVGGQNNYVDVSSEAIVVQDGETYALGGNTDSTSGALTYNSQEGSVRTYKSGLTYETFTAPGTITGYTTQGPISFYYSFIAWGWEPPTTTSITDDTIENGQVGVILGGTDFMDSGATLELCDGPVYATATKVSQTVTGQTDTSLEFTVQRGGLSLGTAYLFVTTDLGQQNSTGYEVTLVGYPAISYVEPGSMQNSDLIVITGTNFGASGATAYVGDNSSYASANKYTLTIFSQSDTEISAAMDNKGAFYGSGWIYVEESGGAYNDSGYGITVLEPDSATVFYGDVAGFGNNPFGRHNYGGMASEIGPVFFGSAPSDGDSNVSTLHVSCKTEIYGFSSRINDIHIEISEDGGDFVDAYYNNSFVSPYNGYDSWLDFHQSDPQKLIAKIVKIEPWEEDVNIIIRVTATDQFGAEATKMATVEW